MKKTRNVKRTLGFKLIWLCLLIFVCLIGGTIFYVNNLERNLWMQSVSQVLEVTAQGEHAFELYIGKSMETVDSLAGKISEKSADDRATIQGNLDLFGETEGDYAVIDLENGALYHNLCTEHHELNEEQIAYYEGFGESGIIEPYLNEYTGQKTMGYYKRLTFEDGGQGMILREQLVSDIVNEFALSFYEDSGFSYIVNADGDILIRSSHKNSNRTFQNVFDIIEGDKGELEMFRTSLEEGKKGLARYQFDGEEHVFAYVPIEHTQGWYLISIIPNAVIMRQTNEILRSTQIFVFVAGAGLIFLAIMLYYIRYSVRRIGKMDREIQLRERMFNVIANNTDDVFLMVNAGDFSVDYVSHNVERVLGIPHSEVQESLTALGQVKYTDGAAVGYETLSVMELGSSIVGEGERMNRKTGDVRVFSEIVYRVDIDGADKFLVILSDRTAERQNKRTLEDALAIAQAANKSKSAFLSNMSHDIRTPINAIMGISVLLQRDADNAEKVREHTRKITSSSRHLLSLINDVLDMSKIESGKTTLNIAELNLAEVIDEVGTIIQQQVKTKKQQFEVFVQDISAEHILGDRLRINQVLINILTNAIKYTPDGGRIEMLVRQLPQKTQNFVPTQFIIKDNGIGMSEEYLENIFKPFTREENSMTSQIQGTGLGMAISKNLIDLMGGNVKVESAPNMGTTFTVNLEFRIVQQDVDPEFWNKHGLSHMLVVDDEECICTSVIDTMHDTGVRLEYALNGASAVEMTREAYTEHQGYDLILLDWKMPDMDGLETAKRIRAEVPEEIPIIILTAYDWSEIEAEAISAGIDGFLPKPFFLSNFKQMVAAMKKEENSGSVGEDGKGDGEKNVAEGNAEEQNSLDGKHFLAAEDIELNAEILTELLSMKGATCDVAENGKEALEMFERSTEGQYDMILMDVQMPIMNGYEATRAIRSCAHPLAKRIPIIAMTANAFADDVKDAMDAGMNAHVAKPIDMDRLEEAVRKLS